MAPIAPVSIQKSLRGLRAGFGLCGLCALCVGVAGSVPPEFKPFVVDRSVLVELDSKTPMVLGPAAGQEPTRPIIRIASVPKPSPDERRDLVLRHSSADLQESFARKTFAADGSCGAAVAKQLLKREVGKPHGGKDGVGEEERDRSGKPQRTFQKERTDPTGEKDRKREPRDPALCEKGLDSRIVRDAAAGNRLPEGTQRFHEVGEKPSKDQSKENAANPNGDSTGARGKQRFHHVCPFFVNLADFA